MKQPVVDGRAALRLVCVLIRNGVPNVKAMAKFSCRRPVRDSVTSRPCGGRELAKPAADPAVLRRSRPAIGRLCR